MMDRLLLSESDDVEKDRYDRQERISWWSQDLLSASKVLVVGAGAIGNETLKNLALLGVGNIYIVDYDRVENTNLARCVLFREGDEGKPKASVAAHSLRQMNSEIRAYPLESNVIWQVGKGIIRRMDVVAGTLDNIFARLYLNLYCSMFSVPYVDAGMYELGLSIFSFHTPETACYRCPIGTKQYEELSDYVGCQRMLVENKEKLPSVITTSSIASAIQAQEIVKLVHRKYGTLPLGIELLQGKEYRFEGSNFDASLYRIRKNEKCENQYCSSPIDTSSIVQLDHVSRKQTAKEIHEEIRNYCTKEVVIPLDFEWILSGTCSDCNYSKDIMKPHVFAAKDELMCPTCRRLFDLKTSKTLPNSSDYTLKDLNIPLLNMFHVFDRGKDVFFEISGDARSLNLK
jgi:adenylyltransferase/sulfurtransferase